MFWLANSHGRSVENLCWTTCRRQLSNKVELIRVLNNGLVNFSYSCKVEPVSPVGNLAGQSSTKDERHYVRLNRWLTICAAWPTETLYGRILGRTSASFADLLLPSFWHAVRQEDAVSEHLFAQCSQKRCLHVGCMWGAYACGTCFMTHSLQLQVAFKFAVVKILKQWCICQSPCMHAFDSPGLA